MKYLSLLLLLFFAKESFGQIQNNKVYKVKEFGKTRTLVYRSRQQIPVTVFSDSSYIECGSNARLKKPAGAHFGKEDRCPVAESRKDIQIAYTNLSFNQVETLIRLTPPSQIRQTLDTAYIGEGYNLKKIALANDQSLTAYIDVYANSGNRGFPADSPQYTAVAYSNIQFEFDSSVLRTSSYGVLDATSADLRSTQKTIQINGYTSSEGTAAHNLMLSRDRANSVKTYLVNSGVDASRIKVKGYGETNPIADNSTEEGRIMNRRVEIKISY